METERHLIEREQRGREIGWGRGEAKRREKGGYREDTE